VLNESISKYTSTFFHERNVNINGSSIVVSKFDKGSGVAILKTRLLPKNVKHFKR